MSRGGNIVDHHGCDFFPERYLHDVDKSVWHAGCRPLTASILHGAPGKTQNDRPSYTGGLTLSSFCNVRMASCMTG